LRYDACSVAVDVAGISIQQDCDTEVDARIEWTFTPDASCTGEPVSGTVQNGFAGFTSPKFGPGVLMATFLVTDDCGNVSICSRAYTIKDCKAPSVSCQSGIVLPLEVGGTVLVKI